MVDGAVIILPFLDFHLRKEEHKDRERFLAALHIL